MCFSPVHNQFIFQLLMSYKYLSMKNQQKAINSKTASRSEIIIISKNLPAILLWKYYSTCCTKKKYQQHQNYLPVEILRRKQKAGFLTVFHTASAKRLPSYTNNSLKTAMRKPENKKDQIHSSQTSNLYFRLLQLQFFLLVVLFLLISVQAFCTAFYILPSFLYASSRKRLMHVRPVPQLFLSNLKNKQQS